jgi:hypothetical protein
MTDLRQYLHSLEKLSLDSPSGPLLKQCVGCSLRGIYNPQLLKIFLAGITDENINTPTLLHLLQILPDEETRKLGLLFTPAPDLDAVYIQNTQNGARMLYTCFVHTEATSCSDWALHVLGTVPVVALDVPLDGTHPPAFPGGTLLGSNGATRATFGFPSPPAMVAAVQSVMHRDMKSVPEKLRLEAVAEECCKWAKNVQGKNWRDNLVLNQYDRTKIPLVQWSYNMYYVFFPPGSLGDPVERSECEYESKVFSAGALDAV